MSLKFEASQPIYLQIMSHIRRQLVTGVKKPGERIESVRELALEYGVNPNTMQKALSELEREGYFHSERTSGRSVTADVSAIEELKALELEKAIGTFINEMKELGIPCEALPEMLNKYLNNREEDSK